MVEFLTIEMNENRTEDGASGQPIGEACKAFFAACWDLRHKKLDLSMRLLRKAYAEDPTLALGILFYARDIRGGLRERDLFRAGLMELAKSNPDTVCQNLWLIPEFGRWDDLLCLLDTACKKYVITFLQEQWERDMAALHGNRPVSLMAKWMPSINTSSAERRRQAWILLRGLGLTEKEYRKQLSALRSRLDVVEKRLCEKDYTADYDDLPTGAVLKYWEAWRRNDYDRFGHFARKRLAKRNRNCGVPHTPVAIFLKWWELDTGIYGGIPTQSAMWLDKYWKCLPDEGAHRNVMVAMDERAAMIFSERWNKRNTSWQIAAGVGSYLAERTNGAFRENMIILNGVPRMVPLGGTNIAERASWFWDFFFSDSAEPIDLKGTFELLLETAVARNVPPEEMPEIIYAFASEDYDESMKNGFDRTKMQERFAAHGYTCPILVYWFFNAENKGYPVWEQEPGLLLVRGYNAVIRRFIMSRETDPDELLMHELREERYQWLTAIVHLES